MERQAKCGNEQAVCTIAPGCRHSVSKTRVNALMAPSGLQTCNHLQAWSKRPRRSLPVAFGADRLSRRHGRRNLCAALKTCAHLIKRRPLRCESNLVEQVVGERFARQRRPRFESTMQRIRHVANLD